jgi:hypothetical protein
MNSEDAIHCSLCRTIEMEKCSEEEGEGEEQATLHGFLISDGAAAIFYSDSRRFLWL